MPVSAKHVGVLDNISGPNGEHLFFRTGQAVYEVVFDPVLGYYVDGPLVTRHGIRDDFDATEFCAAFAALNAERREAMTYQARLRRLCERRVRSRRSRGATRPARRRWPSRGRSA